MALAPVNPKKLRGCTFSERKPVLNISLLVNIGAGFEYWQNDLEKFTYTTPFVTKINLLEKQTMHLSGKQS